MISEYLVSQRIPDVSRQQLSTDTSSNYTSSKMPFNHFIKNNFVKNMIESKKLPMAFFPYWIRIKNAIGKFDKVIVLKSIAIIVTL
jgi:hypothetical protein